MKKAHRSFHGVAAAAGRLAACVPLLARLVPGRRRHVVIVKNDGLGDIVLFLPYAAALYRRFKACNYRVSMIVRSPWAELVRRAGVADRIIVQPPYRGPLQWLIFRFSFWLGNCFDLVIEGVCCAHDLTDCCHPRERINIYMDPCWKSPSSPRNRSFDVSGLTIWERYKLLLSVCGVDGEVPAPDCSVFAAPVPEDWVASPFIAICADSSDPRRSWPIDRFADVADWLCRKYRRRIVFVGSDRDRAEKIVSAMPETDEVLDLCGRTDLFQLFAVVKRADILVSCETGTAHAGAACGTRCFVICGRGVSGIFAPYPDGMEGKIFFSIFSEGPCRGCHWRDPECSRLPVYKCIDEVSAAELKRVIEAHVPAAEASPP